MPTIDETEGLMGTERIDFGALAERMELVVHGFVTRVDNLALLAALRAAEAMQTKHKQELEAAQAIAKAYLEIAEAYFEIAEDAIGEDEVRRQFKERFDAGEHCYPRETPPDTRAP